MPAQKLRALFRAGLTYDEIARINERSEGWRPSRAAVKRKYETIGMPPRKSRHTNLLPWKMRPEHDTDRLRHMLGAEARSREGRELSETDRKLVSQLHELLFGRGKLMVVGYHPEVGFYLAEREDTDEDIIRDPRAVAAYYAEPPLRQESRESVAASLADGDGAREQSSSRRTRQQSSTKRRDASKSTGRRPVARAQRDEQEESA